MGLKTNLPLHLKNKYDYKPALTHDIDKLVLIFKLYYGTHLRKMWLSLTWHVAVSWKSERRDRAPAPLNIQSYDHLFIPSYIKCT